LTALSIVVVSSEKILEVQMLKGFDPSHVTRYSDASSFDELCVNCGATDAVPGGWGKLAEPCPRPPGAGGQTYDEWIVEDKKRIEKLQELLRPVYNKVL
jgi:hypothetical protein